MSISPPYSLSPTPSMYPSHELRNDSPPPRTLGLIENMELLIGKSEGVEALQLANLQSALMKKEEELESAIVEVLQFVLAKSYRAGNRHGSWIFVRPLLKAHPEAPSMWEELKAHVLKFLQSEQFNDLDFQTEIERIQLATETWLARLLESEPVKSRRTLFLVDQLKPLEEPQFKPRKELARKLKTYIFETWDKEKVVDTLYEFAIRESCLKLNKTEWKKFSQNREYFFPELKFKIEELIGMDYFPFVKLEDTIDPIVSLAHLLISKLLEDEKRLEELRIELRDRPNREALKNTVGLLINSHKESTHPQVVSLIYRYVLKEAFQDSALKLEDFPEETLALVFIPVRLAIFRFLTDHIKEIADLDTHLPLWAKEAQQLIEQNPLLTPQPTEFPKELRAPLIDPSHSLNHYDEREETDCHCWIL